MRWIILALSLGASVTSIIHGVFMIFGLLSMPVEGVTADMPSLIMAGLPIASAMFALIGGCIAFNESRWGALFLAVATGLCAFAERDIWIYGGLYLLSAVLCFFLRRHTDYDDYDFADSDYDYDSDDYEADDDDDDTEDDEVYDKPVRSIRDRASRISTRAGIAVSEDSGLNTGLRERRRTSKTCPVCGATVAIGHRFCPSCGAGLHVPEGAEAIVSTIRADRDDKNNLESAKPLNPSPDKPTNVISLEPHLDLEESSVLEKIKFDEPEIDNAESNVAQEVLEVSPVKQADENLRISRQEESRIRVRRRTISVEPEAVGYDDDDGQEEQPMVEERRIPTAPRKVVVRSDWTEQDDDRPPFGKIPPDMSYSNFSKYAHRRKKRRKTSLGKRILGLLILFGVVGGAMWFLLGLRKLPEDELPTFDRPTVSTPTTEEPKEKNEPTVIAEPLPVAEKPNELPPFTPVLTPKRGLITGANVNLREDHTTDSKLVGRKMSPNTNLEFLDTWEGQSKNLTGIWYRVKLGDGREGWVYGKYVQPIGEPLPSGYTNALLKTFGANRTSVVNKLGQPNKSTATTMDWSGISMTFRGEDVVRLRLTSSQRELLNGLRPGMGQSTLTQTMGYPSSSKQRQIQYNEGSTAGVIIQLDANNIIQNITVQEIPSL